MNKYTANQLCSMYPNKYICVSNLIKNEENIIMSAKVLKVYDTLDDCKSHIDEIKFFKGIYKDDFDIIYGDFDDYVKNRAVIKPIDAFSVFGCIAFELFG